MEEPLTVLETPLHRAARLGDIAELERLLVAGEHINGRAALANEAGNYQGNVTPLMLAAGSSDGATVETVRWLLDHGADPEAIAFGIPPAVWFAAGGFQVLLGGVSRNTPDQVARLRLLLEVGPSPQAMADQGRSLLMAACEVEDPARVALLLEQGVPVSPDERGNDAFEQLLYREAASPEEEAVILQILQLLVAAGVDVNAAFSDKSWTRLYAAAFEQNETAIDRLLTLGADVHRGYPPLSGLCWHYNPAYTPKIMRMIDRLVGAGCEVNGRDAGGDTLLHQAALGYSHAPSAKCFHRSSDGCNYTAIHALLQHGAEPDPVGTGGFTPLMLAVEQGCAAAVRELLAAGADPRRQNDQGDTAITLARQTYEQLQQEAEVYGTQSRKRQAFYQECLSNAADCLAVLRSGNSDSVKRSWD